MAIFESSQQNCNRVCWSLLPKPRAGSQPVCVMTSNQWEEEQVQTADNICRHFTQRHLAKDPICSGDPAGCVESHANPRMSTVAVDNID